MESRMPHRLLLPLLLVMFGALASPLLAAEREMDAAEALTLLKKRVPSAKDREDIPKLIAQLSSDKFQQRQQAAARLTAIGPGARLSLREVEKSDDREVARLASACIAEMKKDFDPNRAEQAIKVIAARRPEGTVEVLLPLLNDGEVGVRYTASSVIPLFGKELRPLVPRLIRSCEMLDPNVLHDVDDALPKIIQAEELLPILLEAARDPVPRCRAQALYYLRTVPGQDDKTFPVIMGALKDQSVVVRKVAIWQLCFFSGDRSRARETVPTLLKMLEEEHRWKPGELWSIYDDSESEALQAIQTLTVLGSEAKTAVPPLLKYLKSKSLPLWCRVQVARCLKEIDPEAAKAERQRIEAEYQQLRDKIEEQDDP